VYVLSQVQSMFLEDNLLTKRQRCRARGIKILGVSRTKFDIWHFWLTTPFMISIRFFHTIIDLITGNMCVKLLYNPLIHSKVSVQTIYLTKFDIKPLSLATPFKISLWFFCLTLRLINVNMCAMLFLFKSI